MKGQWDSVRNIYSLGIIQWKISLYQNFWIITYSHSHRSLSVLLPLTFVSDAFPCTLCIKISHTIICLTLLSVLICNLLLGSSMKSPMCIIDDSDRHLSWQTKCVFKRALETHLHDIQEATNNFKHSHQSGMWSCARKKGGVGSRVSSWILMSCQPHRVTSGRW